MRRWAYALYPAHFLLLLVVRHSDQHNPVGGAARGCGVPTILVYQPALMLTARLFASKLAPTGFFVRLGIVFVRAFPAMS
jgi:hypothetical protein